MLGTVLVLFLALRARLGEPFCRGVDLLPPGWDGRFPGGGVFGDAPRSTASSGCSSPLACA